MNALFTLTLAALLAPPKADSAIDGLVQRAAAQRKVDLAKAELDVKFLTTSREKIEDRANKLRKAKATLAQLRQAKLDLPTIPQPFAIGTAGAWTGETVRVRQVLDDATARVALEYLVREPQFSNEAAERREFEFIFKGDTSSMVDGQPCRMPPAVEVSGTYRYETVTGATRTLFVLSEFDASGFAAAAEKASRK